MAVFCLLTGGSSGGMLLPHLALSWTDSKRPGSERTDSISDLRIESWLRSRLSADVETASLEGDWSGLVQAAAGSDDSVLGLHLRGKQWSAAVLLELTAPPKVSDCKSIRRGRLEYRHEGRKETVVLSSASGDACWNPEGPLGDSSPESWGPGSVVWVDFSAGKEASVPGKHAAVARLGGLLEP